MTKEEIEIMVKSAIAAEIAPLMEVQRKYADHFRGGEEHPADKGEKGIGFARFVKSLLVAKRDIVRPSEAGSKLYPKDERLVRALGESTGSSGGYLVPPEYSIEIIELLRAQAVVRKSGARVMPMNSNTLTIPKITAGASATYIGENTNIGKTEPTLGQIQLSAKKLAALVPISNDLIRDSSAAADQLVRDDAVAALATTEDVAFIRYDGTSYKPKGIYYWVNSANKFNSNDTIDLAHVTADLTDMIKRVKASDSKMLQCGWLFSVRTWAYLYSLLNTNGVPAFRDEMNSGKLLGFPYQTTTQIPENLGGTTNQSEIYFGDFRDAVIGENTELLVDVSSEAAYHDGSNVVAAFSLDQTVLRVIMRHDFCLRHDKAFSIMEQVKYGA